jgi:hypothetical protein
VFERLAACHCHVVEQDVSRVARIAVVVVVEPEDDRLPCESGRRRGARANGAGTIAWLDAYRCGLGVSNLDVLSLDIRNGDQT